MRNPFLHGVGGVLSADIAVPEHERELRFYSKVLTTGSTPLWQDDLTNNQGTPVIGLGERSPEYEALPLQWMPHFQVSNVAESVDLTLELGGQELMHAKGDGGQSQWAVLLDPAGAAFGIIPAVEDQSGSAHHDERIGCISWPSLVVSDVASICEFYEKVIGWSAAPTNTESGFEMLRPDGVAAAEICAKNKDNESIPSVWILSLPVDDFDESLRQVREGGGEIIKEMTGADKHTVIKDPVGVYIALQAAI
ncbi:VOC family protein [Gracilimonas sp.]|uniref:VOC family protein n=1 Tax=Gracilimonas sp. TaxID=1974203 RepID=UPI003BAC11F9